MTVIPFVAPMTAAEKAARANHPSNQQPDPTPELAATLLILHARGHQVSAFALRLAADRLERHFGVTA